MTAVRLQSFEDGERTPVRSYVTVSFEEPPATDEMRSCFPNFWLMALPKPRRNLLPLNSLPRLAN